MLRWDGNGSFADFTDGGISDGSLTGGYCRGIPWSNQFTLRISSTEPAPNHVRNIRFYHADDEADYNAGRIFGNKLLARLREARFGVIRFLDWQINNVNHAARWSHNKPLTSYSYYADEFRGAAWGDDRWYFGETTSVGNDYAISTTRGRLPEKWRRDPAQVQYRCRHGGHLSLDVDGSGPVNILDGYGQALSNGGNSYPKRWAYGVEGSPNYATLTYCSVIPAWIKHGGDMATPASGMANGTPPQLALMLCAEVGAHPWFCAPMQSMDPLTDYMPELATWCLNNAPPWMIPRYEPPNECFNNFGGFYSNGNIRARSEAYGWPNDYFHVYGKFASVLGQALDQVYGGDRSRYVYLAAVQTAMGSSNTYDTENILTSAMYVAQAEPAQEGFVKAPASDYLHGLAAANYYAPSIYSDPPSAEEKVLMDAHAAGSTTAVPAYIAHCYDASPGYTLPRNRADFEGWKTCALANGLHLMEFYEGGFSPDYLSGDDTGNAFKDAASNHPDLAQVVHDDYAICTGLTDANFTARNPSHYYLSANRWLHNGVSPTIWALLDDLYETPECAQWQAIVQYNRGLP